ncbi:BRO family protein [Rodentibacter caecimuris]|uniref:BRO family protein n=1 Tax=Rodentibacter caecimuris TaxID=1796644 RepID=UPI0009856CFE|nr:hypothetical protein BKG97_01965 [Rodentibacter heylii]
MSTQIQFQSFNFNSNAVRIITDPTGEFWFCGTDVCTILGYVNAPDALKKHCKETGIAKRYISYPSGKKEAIFINEPNLYRLIIKSRKPEAEPFEAWVFEEVLPQIRKTGKYQLEPKQLELPDEQLPLAFRKQKYARELTEERWLCFASLWFSLYNNLELLERIYKPLEMLGSNYGVTAYTHATEYSITLGITKRILEPLLAEFNVDPREEPHYHLALKTLREYQPKGIGA